MIAEIKTEAIQTKLKRLSRKHFIKELYLFGSATSEYFDPDRSDLDFLVVFNNIDAIPDYVDNFFSVIKKLKRLFKRNIDLTTPDSLTNPYFTESFNKTRIRIL